MIHTGQICRPAWHESATVRRILGRFTADGFPAARSVTRHGIWNDRAGQEYDRDHPGVAALIAVRAAWFELVGDCGAISADALIHRHQQCHDWERAFLAAIAEMRLEFPPHGNDAARAARAGDPNACPAAAAHEFVSGWEYARQESIRRFHIDRAASDRPVALL